MRPKSETPAGTVPKIFDRALLARRLDRAAHGIDRHDFLLARAADDLAERLLAIRRTFKIALGLGADHGVLSRRLRALGKIDYLIDAGLSSKLLAGTQGLRVLADEEALPFAEAAFDLVVSALSLHLVNDLPGALLNIRRVLKPDGLFLGALFGEGTLSELRQSWIAAEIELLDGASPRVAPFAGVRELGGLLQRAGFALPVADTETVTATYPSPLALMSELKGMGLSNVLALRSRRPVTRGLLMRAAAIYAERFGNETGRVPATFDIVTLTGWAPHESQQKPLAPGSGQASLADVLGPGRKR